MENMNTWRLSLCIDNTREIYSITESLSNSLAKKIKKGVKPSVEILANCSTMKRIVSMAAKMVKEYDGETVSTKERKEAALKHAEYIMEWAEYKAKEKKGITNI